MSDTSYAEPRTIDRDLLKTSPLPQYEDDAGKNDYGKLLVIAGSQRLPGAAILAARAALRCGCGCGTVRVAAPQSVALHIGIAVPELMVLPLPETKLGTIARAAQDVLERQYTACDAAVIGPGLDEHEETNDLVRVVVRDIPLPLLVDAQALLALAPGGAARSSKQPAPDYGADKGARVFTPHDAEMEALLGSDIAAERQDMEERAKTAVEFARARRITLVLKGRETLVATPDGTLRKNAAGTRGLGTAGSGDVLAGAIGGLLAQRMDAVRAALWGVHLHALAGEAAEKDLGDDGMMARDFLERLPTVLRFLRRATAPDKAKDRPGLRP